MAKKAKSKSPTRATVGKKKAATKKAAAPARPSGARKGSARPPAPRSQRLPGIEEDPAIRALDNIAAEYVSIRDQRMALNQDEHTLKQNALTLMRRNARKGV